METAGYICNEQSLHGGSTSGNSDGKLDILIKDINHSEDIAIYKALKLKQKTFEKSDQGNLSNHLLKLLNYYNPIGLTNFLLVSYVPWDKAEFDGLVAKYMEFILKNDVAPFVVLNSSMMEHISSNFLRFYKVEYDCAGITVNVYHFIVRIAP